MILIQRLTWVITILCCNPIESHRAQWHLLTCNHVESLYPHVGEHFLLVSQRQLNTGFFGTREVPIVKHTHTHTLLVLVY